MKYSLVRTVKPTDAVVTMAEARAQLRVDTFGSPAVSSEDDKIGDLVAAITESLDAGTGWLGRALAPQTWRLGFKCFPTWRGAIRLPYPPLIEVVSFTYTDTDGNTQTLTEGTGFRVLTAEDGASVKPLFGENWPTDARYDDDAVQITFRCGHVTGSPEAVDIPDQVKNYVLASLTDQFDSRGVGNSALTPAIENSLNSIRVYWP